MAYSGVIPRWLTGSYPGLEGFNIANRGFNYLLNDPGFGQLTASAYSDPSNQQFQAETANGLPNPAAAGAFGRILAGNMGGDVAGAAAQDSAKFSAQNSRVNNALSAANAMAAQQTSNNAVAEAKTKQATGQLQGFGGILNQLTNPQGMGANIMGLFTGKNSSSPLGGLFSSIMGMGSGGGGAGALFGGADILGMGSSAAGVGGISDITASLGSAGAAGGLSDLFASLAESAPMLLAA